MIEKTVLIEFSAAADCPHLDHEGAGICGYDSDKNKYPICPCSSNSLEGCFIDQLKEDEKIIDYADDVGYVSMDTTLDKLAYKYHLCRMPNETDEDLRKRVVDAHRKDNN